MIYVNFNNLLNPRPSCGENSPDIITASLGLIGNGSLDQVRRRIGGDLARDEDLAVCADCLRLSPSISIAPGIGVWEGGRLT